VINVSGSSGGSYWPDERRQVHQARMTARGIALGTMETSNMSDVTERAATWKRVIASILDFFTVLFVGGYGIALFSGGMTSDGFSLNGPPAIALFALIAVYFFVGRRYAGGTLWDRIFRIRRPQPT
jgi:hypothetical protein